MRAARDYGTLDKSKHVLVCPKRSVGRFVDLSAEEVTDLWLTAQRVGQKLQPFWEGTALTLSIQVHPLNVFFILFAYVAIKLGTNIMECLDLL